MKSQIIRFAGVVTLLLAMTSCAPPKNNFVGTWQDERGRAVIDKSVAAFYDAGGRKQGQYPITIVDDHDARIDSALGSGSLSLQDDGTLKFVDTDATHIYHRVAN